MADDSMNLVAPVFYEPCGFNYNTGAVNTRKIVNKNIYIISSFDSNGNIVGDLLHGSTDENGNICQDGSPLLLSADIYYFFVSISVVNNAFTSIKKNMCSDSISITEDTNQTVLLPYFPEIQIKINGNSKKGILHEDGISLLKLFEDPPINNDGTVGLHLPNDGTVTYGYGEVIPGVSTITDILKNQYPNMTLVEADQRLRDIVLPPRLGITNNRIKNRNMAVTNNQFDAFFTVEYNSGDCGPLMTTIKNIENSNSTNKPTEIYNAFVNFKVDYPGTKKRRKAEAAMYLHGFYDENFTY
jgi:GH24 family phage-related lysozyme (muramidase)